MSTAQPHIIRRQFLHVEVQGTEPDGLAVQRKLPELCHGQLAATLAVSLDEALASGEHLLIERLDIDAGEFSLDDLEHDFAGAVGTALRKALRELNTAAGADGDLIVTRRQTSAQSVQEAFLYFLATGHLPWWFHLPTGQTLEEAVHASWGAKGDTVSMPPSFARVLAEASRSTTARRRLALQFSLPFLARALAILQPENAAGWRLGLVGKADHTLPTVVTRFLRQVYEAAFSKVANGQSASSDAVLTECWHELSDAGREEPTLQSYLERHAPEALRVTAKGASALATARPKAPPPSTRADAPEGRQLSQPDAAAAVMPDAVARFLKQVNEAMLAHTESHRPASYEAILLECWHGLSEPDRQDAVLRAYLERHAPRVLRSAEVGEGRPARAVATQDVTVASAAKAARAIEPDSVPRPAKSYETPSHDMKEGVYVSQSGLVLLHPFLPSLFEALGIARGAELVAPERALCLLHYLASGQRSAPEYDLTLPKFLCNVPLEMPVDTLAGPSIDETQEADALLAAVIGHWEALRDTSADGLRAAFLARPGKLTQREDGDYLLQVEAQSLDILLDQLPWGFGTIKLPWMPEILWVEWR